MYKKFEALSEEKQIRIVNSAFNEFAHKQFKEASTDEIAINAGISKGALFQYFGTKKQLYLYIYNYGYEVLLNEMYGQINFANPDLLARLKESTSVKMSLYCKYPTLFDFILYSYTKEKDEDIKALANKELETRSFEMYAKMYVNIDCTLFKEEFDPQHVVAIIIWTLEGYANRESAKLNQEGLSVDKYEKWIKEVDGIIATLRKAFYKEEKHHGERN